MASNGKKAGGRKPKSPKDEQVSTQPTEVEQPIQDSPQSAPVVTDWSKESSKIDEDDFEDVESSPQTKSVLDFDRTQVAAIDVGDVAKLSNEDLIKILVRRGEEQKNPAIAAGCKRLLRQINGETSRRPHHPNSNFSRGRGGFGFHSRGPQLQNDETLTSTSQSTSTSTSQPENFRRNNYKGYQFARPSHSAQPRDETGDETNQRSNYRNNNSNFRDDNGKRNTTRYQDNNEEDSFHRNHKNKYNNKGGQGTSNTQRTWVPKTGPSVNTNN